MARKYRVSVDMTLPYVSGVGATEAEAILNAARRLKELVERLTVEEIAAVLDGEVGDLYPGGEVRDEFGLVLSETAINEDYDANRV